jgi:hypothetical protein
MTTDPYNELMSTIADAMDLLDQEDNCRERSIIQTKLDEAMMWAQRAREQTDLPVNLEPK